MNCTECKGTGFVKQSTDDEHGAATTIKVHCFACSGTGLGTTVRCIICELEQPRRHPGHFMCGNPECREKIVKIVEVHKMKQRMIEPEPGAPSRFMTDMEKSMGEKVDAETVEKSVNAELVKQFSRTVSRGDIRARRRPGDFVFVLEDAHVRLVKLASKSDVGFDGKPLWNSWRDDDNVQFFDVPESEMYDTREAAEAAMHAAKVLT